MNSIQLNHITKIGLTGAEISDFDPKSKRLFVTGEAAAGKPVIQVIDGANPQQLTKITDIDLSTIGAGVQSVAVRKGTGNANSIIAVAVSANVSTNNGKVAFFDAATLTKLSEVEVGALPDMLTFTADGSKLLVANEGEPNEDYSVDPEGSISIIDVSGDIASLNSNNVTTASFTTFNNQETTLKSQGVRIFGKLKSGNNSTVAEDLEPEYIAISPDGKTAFITLQENNAFAVLDIATATITKIVPLGFKDHNLPGNGLDANDRDINGTAAGGGKINIQNWPIFGMYQPDGISSFEIAGKTYYITANEGDARIRPTANNSFGSEGSSFNEESRISSLNLDPTAFPDATNLKNNANLGRLTVTNKLGDTDGDGDFDKLYAFGARSFSIWDDQGQLVFDSGDQLEQITKEITPNLFNANNGNTADFDTRSDNKGPEPESVTIGIIDGKTYGFIGLERSAGGVMVYDLSNPAEPIFIQYISTTGDIAPEGLKFISAQDSPSGKPLLAVSNESSNTVSVYEIGLIKTGTAQEDSLTAFTGGYTVLGLAGDDYISAVETGTGNNILDGGDGNDEIFAKENDIALGGLGNDRLYSDGQGNNSNNTLDGGDGNDEIKPYRNDSVFGGAGDDVIYSGLGGNTIAGGSGKDKFYLTNINEPENPNTITDYNPAEDSLLLNDNSNAELIFTTAGTNTLVSVDGKKLATLQNYQLPRFSIASASAKEGNSISFTIARTGNTQVSQNVTVSTSIDQDDTASDNDFTPKTETLTFAPGETTKVFTVITTQDQRVEKDETFAVALTNPTNGALINNDNNRAKGVIINDDIPLVTPNNNYIFPIKGEGDQVRLRVSLVRRNSNSINELGVFTVDDAQGNINGIAPGAPGYNQSVITRAKVIFSAISNLPNGFNTGDFTRLINFNSGDNLRFFLVQGGTVDSLISGRTPLSNLLIADNFNQKTTDLGTDGFTLSWQDGSRNVVDFQDLVVRVQSTNDKLVIGTGLQGGNQGEIIDLGDIKGQVKADFSVYREAEFNNEVYFYKIDNADGQIGGLRATSANRAIYLQTALNNLIKDAQTGGNIRFSAGNQGIQTGTTTITGGTLLAPMIIVNGGLSQLLDNNTNNDPQVYFPYLGLNSDGADHIRLLGNNTFGFEDLPNGGDLDYNDIIIKMNFTQIV